MMLHGILWLVQSQHANITVIPTSVVRFW